MNNPPLPHLKSIPSTPDSPRAAEPSVGHTAVGEPKGAARKGVRTALRSKGFRTSDVRPSADPTPEQPGIRIYAPPVYRHHYDGARWSKRQGDTPNAAYACPCGQTGHARGQDSVAALVYEYAAHTSGCTGTPDASTEGRAAA
ncbi:hypothetical protein [Streptomyces chartreusis]|uniref:hypothetical protein n=1 Tax=Streptomyces chartreusis TaxID=1969 RepID=UPI0019AE1FD3|nr:hypothetical protein [Streptomyces chartreusis]GGX15958.1 hypothetical protein GCM10010321_32810 [Streptomyces chartreusis]